MSGIKRPQEATLHRERERARRQAKAQERLRQAEREASLRDEREWDQDVAGEQPRSLVEAREVQRRRYRW